MPSALECRAIRKRYAAEGPFSLGRHDRGLDLSVEPGELFAIIGPSGCGKSSLLRVIGGFTEPTSGVVAIDGRDVTRLAPYERPTNTVFQNYALFPHMTVAGNVAFGLEMEGTARPERQRRVAEALRLVGLDGFGHRYVGELSGGQMQRAALARALVKRPAVLLLDEPLGALDLKLRRQMQDEIVRLKTALGTTIVHVTHDQEEACAMADRIAVLKDGMVVQVDRPVELYRQPRTAFVVEFLGAGTLCRGAVTVEGGEAMIEGQGIRLVAAMPKTPPEGPLAAVLPRHGARLRRHDGRVERQPNEVAGTVERLAFTGVDFSVTLDVAGLAVSVLVSAEALGDLARGDRVVASWDRGRLRLVEDDLVPAPPAEAAAA